ncbi:glycosyltransferase [Jatrophihabitans cynanchi]|jgi:CRISPR system Cascade subunit CasB|uniref:Glycosyltransferase n=1 Tax=Jatrophihabitans cynanchi TaxID=2944128 RepID=A0ABY7K3V5_9ACTN|nr:glycosyltransferase [Jatrophihabitans sp. SB3-54]WAX57961.1 glycosyltransferase [Jatrophihabitans sp. SB3-54]
MGIGDYELYRSADGATAPLLSVVVPEFNAASSLAACLDSICGQSFADVEIVLVDDASTDTSLAEALRYAERDSRITLISLRANSGLGMARNAGMALARAPYLLFVDSDDTLTPGALQAVADRIAAAGTPDVVMFGYEWSYPDGRLVPDPKTNELLAHAGPLTIEQRIKLLRIIPVAWNKAYRREYLIAHDFRFPTGVYEDVAWTYPVLMSAGSVVTICRVCYRYERREGVGILASRGRSHFDLITQYDRVFAYIDTHPELEQWRRPLLDRVAWHLPTVLENSTRITPEDRRVFFQATSAAVRRHRPPGYWPAGRLGLKIWLIEHGGYRLFRVAQLLNVVRRRLRGYRRGAC